MLFHSFTFIFAFLPITYLAYILAAKKAGQGMAWTVLAGASLFFYAWWSPELVLLLIGSVLVNYYLSGHIRKRQGKPMLLAGILFNLGLLGYFKYANFFMEQAAWLSGTEFDGWNIILPIGISFFTFQQIAYLVDCARGLRDNDALHEYFLFVTFFPQLIAGPIVHHQEMMPQFERKSKIDIGKFLAPGLTLFAFGLFKKTFIADGMAEYTGAFDYAAAGGMVTFIEAWCSAIAYTFQIYFDFSGYSDMAVGLALMFGIRLPLNFNSPYKAASFVDFWKRWHMSLSRFLRDYVYIPLGGNRRGRPRMVVNFFATMLLGGLWHGAAWTFILWGGFHALLISVNHLWRGLCGKLGIGAMPRWLAVPLTFTLLVFSWVLFRAENMQAVLEMYLGMLGMNGVAVPGHYESAFPFLANYGIEFSNKKFFFEGIDQLALYALLILVVWFAPNSIQMMRAVEPTLTMPGKAWLALKWRPSVGWAIIAATVFSVSLLSMTRLNAFIYFQF